MKQWTHAAWLAHQWEYIVWLWPASHWHDKIQLLYVVARIRDHQCDN